VLDPWRIHPAISQLTKAPLGESKQARNAPCTTRGNRGRAKGEQVQNNTQRRLHRHSPRLPSVRAPNPNHGWMTTIMHPKTLRRPSSNLVASSMKTHSSECPWNLIINFILKFKIYDDLVLFVWERGKNNDKKRGRKFIII
jgi:hypothetical protein